MVGGTHGFKMKMVPPFRLPTIGSTVQKMDPEPTCFWKRYQTLALGCKIAKLPGEPNTKSTRWQTNDGAMEKSKTTRKIPLIGIRVVSHLTFGRPKGLLPSRRGYENARKVGGPTTRSIATRSERFMRNVKKWCTCLRLQILIIGCKFEKINGRSIDGNDNVCDKFENHHHHYPRIIITVPCLVVVVKNHLPRHKLPLSLPKKWTCCPIRVTMKSRLLPNVDDSLPLQQLLTLTWPVSMIFWKRRKPARRNWRNDLPLIFPFSLIVTSLRTM
mmetsp:Transcript_21769/g.53798  ORF Transcript_21769/g.53798 Transcript_21769/m.53798 type:complete len:272 (+) Transcript_21769:1105-1920(+)